MINGYITYKQILAKVYRDTQLNSEISESDAIEFISEALSCIGAFSQYNTVSYCVPLEKGKGLIPCGFYKLIDITHCGKPLYWATESANTHYGHKDNCIPKCHNGKCESTFYINGSYIITSLTDAKDVNITYLGVPVDNEGFPLIPDDVYFIKACSAYIIMMMDYADFRRGKITDKVYEESKVNWYFYVNSARGAANMPSLAQLEGIKNSIKRLLNFPNDYRSNFKHFNSPNDINLSR